MLNRVILVGRLTAAPEMRYVSETGTAMAKFRLAVDRKFQSQKGEKRTDFIPIVTWGKLAERCKEYLVKGQLVGVVGELQIREWETAQGEKRRTAEVQADDVRFLSRPAAEREEVAPVGAQPEAAGVNKGIVKDELDEELGINDEDPFKEDI